MGWTARLVVACIATVASAAAHADLLDFDGVCPSPPCLIGSRYPAYTFTPDTLQILQPGTDGLTGPVGGMYLAKPAGMSVRVNATRNVTSITMRLARPTTTAGPVDVSLWAVRGNQPVAPPIQATLVNAGEWVTVPLGAPAQWDGVSIVASEAIGIDALDIVTPCFGFVDVQPGDAFCNSVEWIANRGVTLGCATGFYCPGANVTRAQMALFLHRLGEATAPKVIRATCTRSSAYATAQRSCLVDAGARSFSRVASAIVSCGVANGAAATKTLASDVVFSDDASTTWQPVGITSFAVLAGTAYASVAHAAAMDLAPGKAYLFAHELVHEAGDAGASPTAECTLVVTVGSRSGTQSPF